MLTRLFAALTVAVALAAPPFVGVTRAAPAFNHIYVIMEENTSYEDVIGNLVDAPYINSLAQTYGFAANYYGVTHPSLPNYVAVTAGDFFGSHSDNSSQVFDQQNLFDQLESKGLTWASYMQSLPSAGFTGAQYPSNAPLYVNKHDPAVLFKDILSSPTRLQNIKPIDQLSSDLATGTAPNFAFIAPDECHDMHGMTSSQANAAGEPWCAYPANFVINHALIQQSDQYLKTLVSTIMGSKAWTADSAIVVTWDENESSGLRSPNRGYASNTGCCASPINDGGGRVPTIVITGTPSHTVSLHPYNHYSLMRTIEDNFGLGCLNNTCNSAVQPMTDLFSGTGTSLSLDQTRGFAVTFTSAQPGQGYVLFGSGPGCQGLVETATRDLGAGTTTHTVLVTGNDLPGTVGDIGLTPGATYSYEVVTASSSGNQVDNNGGACYSFTVSRP